MSHVHRRAARERRSFIRRTRGRVLRLWSVVLAVWLASQAAFSQPRTPLAPETRDVAALVSAAHHRAIPGIRARRALALEVQRLRKALHGMAAITDAGTVGPAITELQNCVSRLGPLVSDAEASARPKHVPGFGTLRQRLDLLIARIDSEVLLERDPAVRRSAASTLAAELGLLAPRRDKHGGRPQPFLIDWESAKGIP